MIRGQYGMRLHKQVFPCRVPRALRSNGFTPFRFIEGPKKNSGLRMRGPTYHASLEWMLS